MAARQNSKTILSTHGTVNVLFANQYGLVAVADSMLSNNALNSHKPTGKKLFKIDSKTICMMAGQYSQGGPDQESSLTLFVPIIMSDFSAQLRGKNLPSLSFRAKAEKLARFFEFRMTANLQALASDSINRRDIEPLFLTLAGYDSDGSLNVAELAFRPDENQSGAFSSHIVREKRRNEPLLPCEISVGLEQPPPENMVRIRKMGKAFFCEAIGINNIVESILTSPDKYAGLPAVVRYSAFINGGPELTVEDMKALALELEKQTEIDQTKGGGRLVGGTAEYAILTNGEINQFSDNPMAESAPPGTGEALNSGQFLNSGPEIDECQFRGQQQMVNSQPRQIVPAQLQVKGCSQSLDGFNFHNSKFIDSELFYFNTGMFEFGDENVVTGSSLLLGPNVDMNNPRVIHLICKFDRDKITTQGKDPLPKCGV